MNGCSRRILSVVVAALFSGLPGSPLHASTAPLHATSPALMPEQHSPFPEPEALRDNVAFWRSVFAEWRQSQVALLDIEHPGLIYEVFELDGKVNDALNGKQRAQVAQRRESWESRLQRIAAGGSLSAEEQALRQRIIDVAGAAAVKSAHLRVRTQRGVRERFRRGMEISGRYDAAFRRAFREAGLPEDLAYLPHVESSFQPNARSVAGAVGMWQFTRTAGERFMTVSRVVDERFDPVASARGAARYLKHAYLKLGDWSLAITSYNHGIQGMMRARAAFGTDFGRIVKEYDGKTFGFASRNFYAEFLAAREIARQPQRFFPEGINYEAPLGHVHIVLERPARAHDLANRYGVAHQALAALNPAWSEPARRGNVAIPAGVMVNLPATAQHHATAAVELAQAAPRSEAKAKAKAKSSQRRAVVHVVRKGDSPWQIAASYGVTLARLMESNQLTKHSVLRPGQRLGIPVNG